MQVVFDGLVEGGSSEHRFVLDGTAVGAVVLGGDVRFVVVVVVVENVPLCSGLRLLPRVVVRVVAAFPVSVIVVVRVRLLVVPLAVLAVVVLRSFLHSDR